MREREEEAHRRELEEPPPPRVEERRPDGQHRVGRVRLEEIEGVGHLPGPQAGRQHHQREGDREPRIDAAIEALEKETDARHAGRLVLRFVRGGIHGRGNVRSPDGDFQKNASRSPRGASGVRGSTKRGARVKSAR